jgi:phosphate transport system substrate-binding protein
MLNELRWGPRWLDMGKCPTIRAFIAILTSEHCDTHTWLGPAEDTGVGSMPRRLSVAQEADQYMAQLKLTAYLALSVALAPLAVLAADIRVRGSTTVADGLLKPEEIRIEKLSGTSLDILPNSTSRGLVDLVEGRADIAMLAEPLDGLAGVLNAKQPGSVSTSQFDDTVVGHADVIFIVHPKNPIRQLSRDQLADLFAGKIHNWLELGGNDQPVLLVGEPTSTPHRLVRDALNISYASDMRVVQNTNQTAIIVAQAPGAISYLSDLHATPPGSVVTIATDVQLHLPLHLVTRRDASQEVKRVVEAAKKLGRK